jgi:putative protein-disulfide isomerase
MNAVLYYIHDPMCSWCWGYRPTWDALQLNLPDSIQVKYIVGGLAPDSNDVMPVEQQAAIKAHWHSISEKLGTTFNFDFWQNNKPRRSTYNACRAVIAAQNQGYQLQMIDAIQQAYYLRALNPSDNDVLINLAKELFEQYNAEDNSKSALDVARFTEDFLSVTTQQVLISQIQYARELTNQGFPSLVLERNGMRRQVAINYTDYHATLTYINNALK